MNEAEDAQELAPEWIDWLVENFVESASSSDLLAPLLEGGVPAELAERAIAELRKSHIARRLKRKVSVRDQLFQLAALQQRLESPTLGAIVDRRGGVDRTEFFERYYAGNRPVVLTDVARDWPALSLWKDPAYFSDKFGDDVIDVCMGRDGDPHCDRNFAQHTRKMTMREYCEWVTSTEESNDGYLISNNRLLENENFFRLLDDVIPPTRYVDPKRFRTFMSFWFGPGGTKTPLHHDGNNILFCQVVGEKEFFLVSPWETGLMQSAQGFYAPRSVPTDQTEEGVRPADESFPHPSIRIVLRPGEALFLPVGWWHQVRALSRSVSLSFLNFHENNHFEWYAPGKLNRD